MSIAQFLRKISEGDSPSISPRTAEIAKQTWHELWTASGFGLPVPAACTGPDGKLMYSWDKDEHHFEVEFVPDQPTELFYRNRRTNELWSDEYVVGDQCSQILIEKLKLFACSTET